MKRALLDNAPVPSCQLVMLPSWRQPVVIYLERRDGHWLVVRRRVKSDGSWDALMQRVARDRSAQGEALSSISKTLPSDLIRKVVETHEARLDDALAKRVLGACESVAQRLRQPDDAPQETDGEMDYFSNWDGSKTVHASAWSPGGSSESGVFVHLGGRLAEYANAPRASREELLNEISADVDRLTKATAP